MDYVVTIFDDQDTRLQYFGDWLKNNGDDRLNYLNTTTYTGFAGAGMVFNFTGTSISVYGQIPRQTYLNFPNPVLNYTIDFGVPYQFIAISGREDMNQQLFFRATGLSLGEHTLVITNEVNDDLLILDYLEVGTSGGGTHFLKLHGDSNSLRHGYGTSNIIRINYNPPRSPTRHYNRRRDRRVNDHLTHTLCLLLRVQETTPEEKPPSYGLSLSTTARYVSRTRRMFQYYSIHHWRPVRLVYGANLGEMHNTWEWAGRRWRSRQLGPRGGCATLCTGSIFCWWETEESQ
ncbi:uncharacterized protein LACBIDRAFT_333366 [Laccaria bicolor S238N-H82]|uniref:Predicted protein n=1 Tax=Laccaria bicolor (strain S238N-H82 / ATCC MYA-4686) TaxID=486041 RepID=B0DVP3_LACBS|nr:uncharacterized protein LACBIDRAFT_333366 [Laccaria bicolor S238N-H82]EDR01286.1 predicted protein [Laccaria bicolor S238N-H82]|eukprot:XP_001887993.1 predicted protein [Laccaria bicolor S238N-H82]